MTAIQVAVANAFCKYGAAIHVKHRRKPWSTWWLVGVTSCFGYFTVHTYVKHSAAVITYTSAKRFVNQRNDVEVEKTIITRITKVTKDWVITLSILSVVYNKSIITRSPRRLKLLSSRSIWPTCLILCKCTCVSFTYLIEVGVTTKATLTTLQNKATCYN